jgi:hypothetical protein
MLKSDWHRTLVRCCGDNTSTNRFERVQESMSLLTTQLKKSVGKTVSVALCVASVTLW